MLKDINLLPDIILFRYKKRLKAALIAAAALLVCCGIFAGASVRTFQRLQLEREVKHLNQKIDATALDELESTQQEAELKQQELDRIETAVEEIGSEKLSTAELITHLAQQLPSGVSAEKINIKASERIATVEMTADKREDIVLLLKRLNDDLLYSSVNISPINGMDKPFGFTVTLEITK